MPLFLNGAFYEQKGRRGGRKVIPSKIFWQPGEESIRQAYGRMGGGDPSTQPIRIKGLSAINAWFWDRNPDGSTGSIAAFCNE